MFGVVSMERPNRSITFHYRTVMRTSVAVSMITSLGCMTPLRCVATNVGISIVEQPINLGAKSDPARIPLGRVGVISNYDYGIHRIIGEARPCPDGAMRWENGSELDQNLASVFGISVEAQDSTQIMAFPVKLRDSSWKPPGYSPYTKDQVLAATLWCLLRSTHSTAERPLNVRVVAEDPDDKPLEVKYSGRYFTDRGKDEKEVPSMKVAGSIIEDDARGIAWVKFPEVASKVANPAQSPGMIILKDEGDDESGWHLLPIWGSDSGESDFLSLNNRSAAMCYSSWHSTGITDANSYLAEGGSMDFRATANDGTFSASFSHPRVPQATLAADILALVISAQPTDAKPLTVSFHIEESALSRFPAFHGAAGWKETRNSANPNLITFECAFVWDPSANKLTKGSIPLVELKSRGWIALKPGQVKGDAK